MCIQDKGGEIVNQDPFKEYMRQSEPNKQEKASAWSTAIGLQSVDGLEPSKYLIEKAIQNIEGDISISEVQDLIHTYYEENPECSMEDRKEEADKVSARIVELLAENAFSFTPNEYLAIHRHLFSGLYSHAGKIREYNITKKEWVLNGQTVMYGSVSQLYETLEYDIMVEKNFSYKGLSMDEIIRHLALFISRLWQIHIFTEGNTRTTAVFLIKYLRMLGIHVTNEMFADNSWYFRNALVRANYTNVKENVFETTIYLEYFLRNLLLNEENKLKNRDLHIKVYIEEEKVYIKEEKVYIEEDEIFVCLDKLISENSINISNKTIMHIQNMYNRLGTDIIFGRTDVINILNIQASGSSKLINKMLEIGVIEPVKGHGKGKYKFISNFSFDK